MELFGSWSSTMQFIVVFLLILALLVPLAWRFFGAGSPSFGPRGRRLAVIETAPLDVRHRIVLVKRDNVEHLLLLGGSASVVIESGISRSATREPRPIPDGRSEAARAVDVDWAVPEPVGRQVPVVDLDAALPEPPARTAREAMVDSMRAVRSGVAARRAPPPADEATPLAPESGRVDAKPRPADNPRRAAEARPQGEAPPPSRQVQPVPPAAQPSADEGNFAEMAQRLEAALRRPNGSDAAPQRGRQDPAPAGRRPAAADAPARRGKSAEAAPPDLKVLPGKGQNELAMENLEDEMAKMLGRPAKS